MSKALPAIVLCFLLGIMGCHPTPTSKFPTPVQLNIFVYDQSESSDYIHCDTAEIKKLITTEAKSKKVYVVGIRILDKKSIEQQPLIGGPFHLQLVDEKKESIYRSENIKAGNLSQQVAFTQKVNPFLQQFQKIVLGNNNLPFSDVEGALSLARIMANQAKYRNADIRLIILSDLKQDNGEERELASFIFPDNTTIISIGKAPHIDLQRVFPKNHTDQLIQFNASFFQ